MTIFVQRAISDVSIEPDTPALTGDSSGTRWEQFDKMHWQRDRCERIDQRTTAEGFDD